MVSSMSLIIDASWLSPNRSTALAFSLSLGLPIRRMSRTGIVLFHADDGPSIFFVAPAITIDRLSILTSNIV